METLKNIHSHCSIRKYLHKAIPEEIMTQIIEAGIRSPSSGNMQPYSIIITTDIELKKRLYKAHMYQSMALEAPAVITFCADFNRMSKWLKLNNASDSFNNFMSLMIGAIDAILVSQTCAIAAEDFGLGTCYMGSTLANADQIGDILNLPKRVMPVVGYSIGYPDEFPDKRDRLPMSGLVHRDIYKDYTDEEIQEIYKEKDVKGWKRYMEIEQIRNKVHSSGAENLAQIYTKVKYTLESYQDFSNRVLSYAKKQGWMDNGI